MGDVNKTTHTGTAITTPSFTYLSNKTPMAFFTLKVRETWLNKAGKKLSRDNILKFEALSKNAYWVRDNVKIGRRYYIDGYARTESIHGVEDQKFRILHITEEDNEEYQDGRKTGYKEGVDQAVAIVSNSTSLESALGKLELISQ